MREVPEQVGWGIDRKVGEGGEAPGQGVALLLEQLERRRPALPITCSHASSMGLLPLAAQQRLA